MSHLTSPLTLNFRPSCLHVLSVRVTACPCAQFMWGSDPGFVRRRRALYRLHSAPFSFQLRYFPCHTSGCGGFRPCFDAICRKAAQREESNRVLFGNRKCCVNVKSSLIIVTPSHFVWNDWSLLSLTDATALFKARAGDMFYANRKKKKPTTTYCRRVAESSRKVQCFPLCLNLHDFL